MSKSLLFAALAVISISFCFGQVPQTLSYQGLLTDNSGAPLTDGSYAVTFRFYSAVSGGTAITSRGPLTVNTFKGLFMITLGDGTTDNAALPFSLADQEFFVGITVSPSTTELAPRVKVTAIPYAFVANSVKNVDAAVINSGTLPIARIADNSITNAKLATGIDGSKIGTGINASNITTGILSLTGTDAAKLPGGTTAQRPGSPVEGQIRYNLTEKVMEYYNGTNWYFLTPKVCILKQEKNNQNGGTGISDNWVARELTIRYGDVSIIPSFTGTSFDLTGGEYIIEASAPAFRSGTHQIRLDVSNSAVAWGSNQVANDVTGAGMTTSELHHYLILSSGSHTIQIKHYVQSNIGGDQSLGFALVNTTNAANTEIYAQVKITKLR